MKELVKGFVLDAKAREIYEFIERNWYLEQELDEYPDLAFFSEPQIEFRKTTCKSTK